MGFVAMQGGEDKECKHVLEGRSNSGRCKGLSKMYCGKGANMYDILPLTWFMPEQNVVDGLFPSGFWVQSDGYG